MGVSQRGPHLDVPSLPQIQVLQLGSEGPGPPRPPFIDEPMTRESRVGVAVPDHTADIGLLSLRDLIERK